MFVGKALAHFNPCFNTQHILSLFRFLRKIAPILKDKPFVVVGDGVKTPKLVLLSVLLGVLDDTITFSLH